MLDPFLNACRTASAGEFWLLSGFAVAGVAIAGVAAWKRFAALRELEGLQTRDDRYQLTGYRQLTGRAAALPGPEIVSPLTGTRCLWWSYAVHEIETDDDGVRVNLAHAGTSDALFLLRHRDGDCVVDPEGAEIEPSWVRRWSGASARPDTVPTGPALGFGLGRYRYTEKLVLAGDPLYAAGWLRSHAVTGSELRRDVAALIAEWKQDRAALLRRFDTDGNGEIDAQEWEAARLAALDEVQRRHEADGLDRNLLVLCAPPDGRPYLLSARPQAAVLHRRRLVAHALLATATTVAVLLVLALHARFSSAGA